MQPIEWGIPGEPDVRGRKVFTYFMLDALIEQRPALDRGSGFTTDRSDDTVLIILDPLAITDGHTFRWGEPSHTYSVKAVDGIVHGRGHRRQVCQRSDGDPVMRLDWPLILVDAAEIVLSYDTAVTLRQLFYRLVAKGVLQNTSTAYKTLSARTAAARRNGGFPALADNTRKISQYRSFDGPDDAREWLARIYQRDRTEGQEYNILSGSREENDPCPARSLVW